MNHTTPNATALPRARAADLALLALAGVFGAAVAAGATAPTTAGLALAGLSLVVTLVVLAFARRQLRADRNAWAFVRLAIALAVATVLLAFTADALLLVAAWIVSGRLMTAMIGHAGPWAEARAAARRASIAFAVSDLALVGAVLLLALGAGSTRIAAIVAAAPAMATAHVVPAAFLLVLAALARCALPPFSDWLMRSLAAPTPVSALMHAGFVNAGGFLLVRLAPVIEAAPAARLALFVAGIIAVLHGSAVMLVRSDVKGALAASTVAQMGFMLLTVALGAYAAALWHLVAHGLFKAWLFLGSAGTVSNGAARTKALAQPWPAIIALATVGGAFALVKLGEGGAVLPVGIASAALLGALVVGFGAALRSPLGLIVAAAPVTLIALNALALRAMAGLQPDAAQPLVSDHAQFALLALLLAGWVVQQRVASGGQTLPPRLYARLIHLGHPAN